MAKIDPSMGIQDLIGKDGLVFARVFALPGRTDLALAKTTENGRTGLVMHLNAMGMALATNVDCDGETSLDDRHIDALIRAIDHKKAKEFQDILVQHITKTAPTIASVASMQEALGQFDSRFSIDGRVARIHEKDGQQFLAVRAELSKPGDRLGGVPAIRIFGDGVEETVKFESGDTRDAAFSSPARMDAVLSSLASRQVGHDLLSAASRPKMK